MKNNIIKKQVLIFTGFHWAGKSTAVNLVKDSLHIGKTANLFDYISNLILNICNINLTHVKNDKYNNNNYLTFLVNYNINKYSNRNEYIMYIVDNLFKNKKMNKNIFIYFIENIIKCKKFNQYDNEDINKQIKEFNLFYINRSDFDNALLYKLSKDLVNIILLHDSKINLTKLVMDFFKPTFSKTNTRLVYYAYSVDEINYIKTNYDSYQFQIDMDHVYRSNALALSKNDNFNLLFNKDYINEMEKIKSMADFVIVNNFTLQSELHNKITSVFN